MYYTTGFDRDELIDLCAIIHDHAQEHPEWSWPPILGLYRSVVVALTYLRRNRVQAELAEYMGVSQPTISRAVCALTPIFGEVLAAGVPVAEDLTPGRQLIVDGTLLPCWSWAQLPELYSGKHHTTGCNVQVACDLDGRLAWVSDPQPGRTHDVTALRASGVLDTLDPADWMGDKGYLGAGMLTPIRKPPGRPQEQWEKDFNKSVNKIRYVIERTIAHVKNWRILHTDYRRPYATFKDTISTVIALIFHQAS